MLLFVFFSTQIFAEKHRRTDESFTPRQLSARTFHVKGVVVDAETKEPLPFVNVFDRSAMSGTVTDLDGNFSVEVDDETQNITFYIIGYESRDIPMINFVKRDTLPTIKLKPQNQMIGEVVARPDNLAERVIRKALSNKDHNNPEQQPRSSFEKYELWEYWINNIGPKLQSSFLLRKNQDLMIPEQNDSTKGSLPVYFTETISKNEIQNKPRKLQSTVLADKVYGLDIFKQYEIGGFSSAMDIGISFYDNTINAFGKAVFVSPLADDCLNYYKYYVVDSCYSEADSTKSYILKYKPKTSGNLCFEGMMQIETKYYSLEEVYAEMPKGTNINFTTSLTIYSNYQMVEDSIPFYGETEMTCSADWIPFEIQGDHLGIKVRMYQSMKDVKVSGLDPVQLSANAVNYETLYADDYKQKDDDFWEEHRHQDLTEKQEATRQIIDEVNENPTMKILNIVAKAMMTSYVDLGEFEVGPYQYIFDVNKVEGLKLGIGGRTSKEISETWTFMANAGVGFKNYRPSGEVGVSYRIRRALRRCFDLRYSNRLIRLGESRSILYINENALTTSEANIMGTIFKREKIYELYYEQMANFKYSHEWRTGIETRFEGMWREDFSPKYYPFRLNGEGVHSIKNWEVTIDNRFSFREKYFDDGTQRIYMGTDYPVFHVVLAAGETMVKGRRNAYFRVHSVVKHTQRLGQTALDYAVENGFYIGKVPYPILSLPRGNKTYGLYIHDFNLMNYLEFVNDKYIYVYADYFLNGKLLNHIPYMDKIGLREVFGIKAMLGGFSDKHLALLDMPDIISSSPWYAEASIGLDNIIRLFRLDLIYRFKTNENMDVPRLGLRLQFGVKM